MQQFTHEWMHEQFTQEFVLLVSMTPKMHTQVTKVHLKKRHTFVLCKTIEQESD